MDETTKRENQKLAQDELNRYSKNNKVRRWHFINCFQNPDPEIREARAYKLIEHLKEKHGIQGKIFSPLPQHKTSGHTHVVALCNLYKLCEIGGVEAPKYHNILGHSELIGEGRDPKEIAMLLTELRRVRGYAYIDEPKGPYPRN